MVGHDLVHNVACHAHVFAVELQGENIADCHVVCGIRGGCRALEGCLGDNGGKGDTGCESDGGDGLHGILLHWFAVLFFEVLVCDENVDGLRLVCWSRIVVDGAEKTLRCPVSLLHSLFRINVWTHSGSGAVKKMLRVGPQDSFFPKNFSVRSPYSRWLSCAYGLARKKELPCSHPLALPQRRAQTFCIYCR